MAQNRLRSRPAGQKERQRDDHRQQIDGERGALAAQLMRGTRQHGCRKLQDIAAPDDHQHRVERPAHAVAEVRHRQGDDGGKPEHGKQRVHQRRYFQAGSVIVVVPGDAC